MDVAHEGVHRRILVMSAACPHCLQVHGTGDDVLIVRHLDTTQHNGFIQQFTYISVGITHLYNSQRTPDTQGITNMGPPPIVIMLMSEIVRTFWYT